MWQTIQQTYRHHIQQQIVRQVMASQTQGGNRKDRGWETGGIFALFSAAAVCGIVAQIHFG